MQTAWLNEAQVGIKIAGRNINNFRYADDTTLMAESDPEKISSKSAFPRGWEQGFIGCEKSRPPSGAKGSQLACLEASIWKEEDPYPT